MPISKVGSKGIKDAELSAADIAPGTITSAKIAPGTIASDRLAGGITNAQLAGSIANDKLANSTTTINGTAIALGASGTIVAGTDWQAVVTSDTTMVASRGYFVNTTGGAITMTLPASPSAGDFVEIIDYAGTAATNNITVARNGSNIAGAASNIPITANRTNNKFTYIDATQGWIKTNDDEGTVPTYTSATGGTITTTGDFRVHTFNSSSNFVVSDVGNSSGSGAKVSYMVIAGGGGGGEHGGGAGGYREGKDSPIDSYTASPLAASDSALTLAASTTYPITVGAGGNGQAHNCGGIKGSNSVFSTITSTGGGGGGPAPNPVVLGGSGGGREPGVPVSCQSGNHPPVSPPQGNPGGQQSGTRGGGGGGAGGAGGSNAAGLGVTSSITGSSVARAGGGIGGHNNNAGTPTTPVAGGGSINAPGTAGGAATANTGGGGSGGWSTGGNGGSGTVILRYKYQN